MNAIVYDCEIAKAIQGKNENRIPGIEYCNGWSDKAGMGIAVIVVYEYAFDRYQCFTMEAIDHFRELVRTADLVCGWNNLSFDDPLVYAVAGIEIPAANAYDLYAEITQGRRVAGYRLDDVARANGLPGKSGDGTMAPVMWQRGQKVEVASYCLWDNQLTVKLINKVLATGELNDPRSGMIPLSIRRPW